MKFGVLFPDLPELLMPFVERLPGWITQIAAVQAVPVNAILQGAVVPHQNDNLCAELMGETNGHRPAVKPLMRPTVAPVFQPIGFSGRQVAGDFAEPAEWDVVPVLLPPRQITGVKRVDLVK